jgi:hypothetical protein
MFRILLLVHRYLGIAIGFLVLAWCLSAFVMMYVQFPQLRDQEQLAALPEIAAQHCCNLDFGALAKTPDIVGFVIESIADRPVLRIRTISGVSRIFDLVAGLEIEAIDEDKAQQQAISYFRAAGIADSAQLLALVERDQWTVAGNFDSRRPFFLFAANDEQGSQIYISAVDGTPIQDTTRIERGWNWFGAVTHWIYPTILRQHVGTWSWVVIWTTIVSLFLVVIGVYLGIRQFRTQLDDGFSPYSGITLWHHYVSLIFGTLTLTWLLSGLFSMTPWGLFAAQGATTERESVRGMSVSTGDISTMLTSLATVALPKNTVRIRSAPFDGQFAVLALGSDNSMTRLDGYTLRKKVLSEENWSRIPALLAPGIKIFDAGWINEDDPYYFSHHEVVDLPVYRVIIDDEDRTRYYFHRKSAELVVKVDASARGYRWWFEALHRGDFARLSQIRPLWDLIMLSLLVGVTVGAFTGVYLGFRRVFR